jgi:hypothetical protein
MAIQISGLLSGCNYGREAKNQRREKDRAAKRHRIVPPELQMMGAQLRRPFSPVRLRMHKPTPAPT